MTVKCARCGNAQGPFNTCIVCLRIYCLGCARIEQGLPIPRCCRTCGDKPEVKTVIDGLMQRMGQAFSWLDEQLREISVKLNVGKQDAPEQADKR